MKIPVRCGALMCAFLFKSTIALFAMKEPPAEARTPISAVPFTISEAGSYYLTGNLTASDSTSGITISADNVTLDLNGFALIGGGSGSVAGIVVPVAQKNLCIRNGTVRGWTNGGVRADTARNSRLENLRVSNNSGDGNNGAAGLVAGPGSSVKNCVAADNPALPGIRTLDGCTIVDCTASGNGLGGITGGNNVTVSHCTASDNVAVGINVVTNSLVTGCTSSGNSVDGIVTSYGCTVSDCTAGGNGRFGIYADQGSVVRGCNATLNVGSGIVVTAICHVTGNTCDENSHGGALVQSGLRAIGNSNRIEGNSSTFTYNGGTGIEVLGHFNLIIRNSARGNGTNYSIAADNRYGPIINITANGTSAVSGNSAVSTVASTDPWANFAY